MRLRSFATILALSLATLCGIAQVANGKLQIHHIDMGQGDAAVLVSPKGTVVLFDAGKDMANRKNCDVETSYLDQLGVKQIDYIFVSHYHTDHIGCIPTVLKQFPLKGPSYDRGQSYQSVYYTNYVNAVGTARKTATLGQTITLDGGTDPVVLSVLSINGTYQGGSVSTTNENDLSVSVLVTYGAFREEIGGDLSGENTSNYQDIETGVVPSVGVLDVYKAHHHCSAYSTNEAWLKATQPTVVVISTGDGNSYRHPADSCLERIHDSNVSKVYWTETGAGGSPQTNDVVAGNVEIEIAPQATSYTVSYGGGNSSDTYSIKGGSSTGPGSTTGPTTGTSTNSPTAPTTQTTPRYAYSSKGRVYYYADCPAVKQISKANLLFSDTPPAGMDPSNCVKDATQ